MMMNIIRSLCAWWGGQRPVSWTEYMISDSVSDDGWNEHSVLSLDCFNF